MEIKLSIIWGTVIVLIIAILAWWAVTATNPRGTADGRLTCVTSGADQHQVVITCKIGPNDPAAS